MNNSLVVNGEVLYTPTPLQQEYHEANEPKVLMWGNRGGGKSYCARFDAHMRALAYPGYKYCILRRNFPELEKTHLLDVPAEMHKLGGYFHKTQHIAYYPNGSTGFFSHCSTDDHVLNLLSAQFYLIFFDEVSTFEWDMFTKLSSSCRVPANSGLVASVRAATNPLGVSADEINRHWVLKDITTDEEPTYNPTHWKAIRTDLKDNPHLDAEQYKVQLGSLAGHVRKAWIDGEFGLENALFDFIPRKDGKAYHVTDYLDLQGIIKNAQIYRVYDAGWYPDPSYCAWIAHLGHRFIVFHEKIWYKTVVTDIAEQIKQEDEKLGIKKVAITFCLPLDAPVWMGDYSFKPLSEVQVGDEVIGTCNKYRPEIEREGTRKGKGRRKNKFEDHLRKVKVTAIHRTRQEVLKITMKSGRILYCTPDHQWLSGIAYKQDNQHYIIPKVGSTLVHVVDDPGSCPDQAKAAWLGGIYDGEGCRNYIAQSRDHNPEVYEQINNYLLSLGFDAKPVYKLHPTNDKKYESGIRFNGGFEAALKFANWIPSVRFSKSSERYLLISKYKERDEVVSIESCGMQDVGCLTTESGDFIAYGYVTSNCDPTIDIKTVADVRTIKDMFEENGIAMECSINNREHFASMIHSALAEEAEPGVPRLQVYVNGREGAPYLAKTLPQMRYDPKHPLRLADHHHDHATVALAYFLISSGSMEHKEMFTPEKVKKWLKPKIDRWILGNESVRKTFNEIKL